MATPQQAREFLRNFDLLPGVEYKPLPFRTYLLIVRVARAWYNQEFSYWIADCFDPDNLALDPGYEDSCCLYHFNYPSEEEIELCDWFGPSNLYQQNPYI